MTMKTFKRIAWFGTAMRIAMMGIIMVLANSALAQGASVPIEDVKPMVDMAAQPALFYAIAIVMAAGCLGAAFAVGKIGAAVMGAAAEKPEVLGKAIAFVGLGEGIALFGFLISLFMVLKIA